VQLRGGERHAPEASAGQVVADEQQLFSVPEREVFEEHRVHEAEDRRGGADAEAERENRERSEQRCAAEVAQGVAQVGEGGFDGVLDCGGWHSWVPDSLAVTRPLT
jgi:hypothetical protein